MFITLFAKLFHLVFQGLCRHVVVVVAAVAGSREMNCPIGVGVCRGCGTSMTLAIMARGGRVGWY